MKNIKRTTASLFKRSKKENKMKPKEKMTYDKKKKIIKGIKIGVISVSATTAGLAIFTFFYYCYSSQYSNWAGVLSTPEIGNAFLIGFCLGFLFILWYPATLFLSWSKKRKLKNLNLKKDLELKDAKIASYTKHTNTPYTPDIEIIDKISIEENDI